MELLGEREVGWGSFRPNGGLNLSILDGWWVEGYDLDNGWAIGAGEEYDDPNYQDEVESKALFDVLENEVIPLYYDRTSDGLPRLWIGRMKKSMMKLAPVFNTNRMVQEYTERYYLKAKENWDNLSADNFARTKQLVMWKQFVRDNWNQVKIVNAGVQKKEVEVGFALKVEAEVAVGQLKPEDIQVQILSGQLNSNYDIVEPNIEKMECTGQVSEGLFKYEGYIPCDESGLFGYSLRVMPYHRDMSDQFGLELMRWIGDIVPSQVAEKTKVAT